jgi:hypothetical protein
LRSDKLREGDGELEVPLLLLEGELFSVCEMLRRTVRRRRRSEVKGETNGIEAIQTQATATRQRVRN